MAITMPGANVRLLPGKSRVLLQPRWITIHTMVGTLEGTESYFTPAGRPYSHFGLGGNGEIRQWQDLAFRAASDLEGNPFAISIECEDHGPRFPRWSGSDVPAFTPEQVDTLIVALSWLCHRFGLPKAAITTSCPHERGIGYHRLGVDPWRNRQCGQRWSSARGKVCPGDRRIHQLLTEIIPRVSAPQGGPMSDALERASAIYLWGKTHGLSSAEIRAVIDRGVDAAPRGMPTLATLAADLAKLRQEVAKIKAPQVDVAKLAEEIARRLPSTSGPVRIDDLTEALRRCFAEIGGSAAR